MKIEMGELFNIIKEEVYNNIDESNDYWYHGTPDNRELMKVGSFTEKTGIADYVSNPQKYFELQKQMKQARENGDDNLYMSALNQVGDLNKKVKYKKPIFFTDKRSVANTYADDSRAFDYQNADPSIIQTTIDDSGKVLKILAYGERFRGIKADVVKNSLMKAGIPEETVDKYFNMFTNYIRKGEMSSETLGIIAQQLGFDVVDVLGVYDSSLNSEKN